MPSGSQPAGFHHRLARKGQRLLSRSPKNLAFVLLPRAESLRHLLRGGLRGILALGGSDLNVEGLHLVGILASEKLCLGLSLAGGDGECPDKPEWARTPGGHHRAVNMEEDLGQDHVVLCRGRPELSGHLPLGRCKIQVLLAARLRHGRHWDQHRGGHHRQDNIREMRQQGFQAVIRGIQNPHVEMVGPCRRCHHHRHRQPHHSMRSPAAHEAGQKFRGMPHHHS
mmetsp:Transcript_19009/g.43673  ORF Transcript_19009/g.43673 Transcript_19009/m.43673 type:complete len:225 (-) Transcript_19009:211-885(-)